MLGDKELKAFVPTIMPEKARFFYRDILGLNLLSEDDYAMQFDANGIELRVTILPELKPWVYSFGLECTRHYICDQITEQTGNCL